MNEHFCEKFGWLLFIGRPHTLVNFLESFVAGFEVMTSLLFYECEYLVQTPRCPGLLRKLPIYRKTTGG